MTDRSRYFSPSELRCRHTGYCNMDPDFLVELDLLRSRFGGPLRLSSAYRHPTHPVEAKKPAPGLHAQGKAVDIAVAGTNAHMIVGLAIALGFTGIGVQQLGPVESRFIHIDRRDGPATIWSYPARTTS